MGADLYIEPQWSERLDPVRARCGKQYWKADEYCAAREAAEVDLYFRDSYNPTSVLGRLGMSWWRDVIPMLDAEQRLMGETLTAFRERVATAHLDIPTVEWLLASNCKVNDDNPHDKWVRYYTDKRDRLLAFLDRAIAAGSHVECSL